MMVEAPLVVRREAQEVAAHCDRDDGKSSVKLARIRRPLTALKHRSVPSDQRNFDSCLLVGIPAFPAALYRVSRFLRCSEDAVLTRYTTQMLELGDDVKPYVDALTKIQNALNFIQAQ